MEESQEIMEYLDSIRDPRADKNKKHQLRDILVITICGVICGADDWVKIEHFARCKESWFRKFLELPNGIPSHDTFGRLFARLCPEEFRKGFLDWISGVAQLGHQEVVAIDGKTLRRSHDRAKGKAAIQMVSAWASENGMVLGQVKTDSKSNEIRAIPKLLQALALEGTIVTIDAAGCQKQVASLIRKKGADYVLALKGNQAQLYQDIKDYLEMARAEGFKDIAHDYWEETDGGHGRVEIRRYWVVDQLEWLEDRSKWQDLGTIGMVEAERHTNQGRSIETRFYISSLERNAEVFGKAVRKHWTIENRLHWVLDVAFREDDCRVRKDHAPENLAILRHLALNLIRQDKTKKGGIKTKRLVAGWDHDYLLHLLGLAKPSMLPPLGTP